MSTAARRIDLGLCRDCCDLPVPGRRRCRAHLAAVRTKARRRLEDDEHDEPQAPVARCRCLLALPCHDCIPTARDYAEQRKETP